MHVEGKLNYQEVKGHLVNSSAAVKNARIFPPRKTGIFSFNPLQFKLGIRKKSLHAFTVSNRAF